MFITVKTKKSVMQLLSDLSYWSAYVICFILRRCRSNEFKSFPSLWHFSLCMYCFLFSDFILLVCSTPGPLLESCEKIVFKMVLILPLFFCWVLLRCDCFSFWFFLLLFDLFIQQPILYNWQSWSLLKEGNVQRTYGLNEKKN